MAKICVVGGGTAGSEAAREAAERGADVTLVERSEMPDPPWRSWLNLLRPWSREQTPAGTGVEGGQEWSSLKGQARSAGPGFVVLSNGFRLSADAVVMATGCGFEAVSFPGLRKPGVVVLDSAARYSELGRAKDDSDRVLVYGEGFRSLQVAEALLGEGREIGVLASTWQTDEPGSPVLATLEGAAQRRGIAILKGALTRAVGSSAVEAVVVGGRVVPFDALVVVPRRTPRVVQSDARLGRGGGFLVDRTLRTDCRSTYAAGGCAELGTSFAPSRSLADEAGMSGRVAGANCMGECIPVGSVRTRREVLLGLVWSKVGIVPGAKDAGLGLETTSHSRGDSSACRIVYRKTSGRIAEVEWVDEVASYPSDNQVISSGLSLRMLAYGSSGSSSDISLVSDTARLGLAKWRRS